MIRRMILNGIPLTGLFLVLFLLSPPFVFVVAAADHTGAQWGFAAADGIHVPSWNDPSGNMENEIILAVLDGGIDYSHEDLKDIVYVFSEEEQKALGCGKYGYDATTGKNNDPPPDDHASHVAGIIGASWNGIGISGVCSNVKIISVCCSVGNDTPLDFCLEGYAFIERCIDYGIPIRVVNNSWGNVDSSLAMNQVVEAVGKKGCLSVFTAGNYADNTEDTIYQPEGYFSGSPYAVVVGACDRNGTKASFSSHGETSVDLYAPGVDILSAIVPQGGIAYDYMSGTSMACPAVTGAAAYLAGNHPEIRTAPELRRLLLSCVRPTDNLDVWYGNGMLDLSVEETLDRAPVIEEVIVSGNILTVQGSYFGRTKGELLVLDDTNGGAGSALESEIVKWSDKRIDVRIDDTVPALIRIYLETNNQKHDATLFFTQKSAAVYQTDLPVPHGADAPDKIDCAPDYQAAGFLCGIGEKLYYMPMFFLEEDITLAYDLLYSYDIEKKQWQSLRPLPEIVIATQACVYQNEIVICGVSRDLTHSVAYLYDIPLNRWHKLDSTFIPLYTSVVNMDDRLYLVGGADGENGKTNPHAAILSYDPGSGACTEAGSLAAGVWGAQAVYGKDTLYVYGHITGGDGANRQVFQRITDEGPELLSGAFPVFRAGEGNRRPKFNTALHGALVAGNDALFLVGPMADDGKSDTYRMGYDEDVFLPCKNRLSDAATFWPAACIHHDDLYAISRSLVEPGFELFRSTPVKSIRCDYGRRN